MTTKVIKSSTKNSLLITKNLREKKKEKVGSLLKRYGTPFPSSFYRIFPSGHPFPSLYLRIDILADARK